MSSSFKGGAAGGAIAGCVVTSEIGCVEGIIPGAIIGALSGAAIGTYHWLWNNGPTMTSANENYANQMSACAYIP
jgi:hypothetical protein